MGLEEGWNLRFIYSLGDSDVQPGLETTDLSTSLTFGSRSLTLYPRTAKSNTHKGQIDSTRD